MVDIDDFILGFWHGQSGIVFQSLLDGNTSLSYLHFASLTATFLISSTGLEVQVKLHLAGNQQ